MWMINGRGFWLGVVLLFCCKCAAASPQATLKGVPYDADFMKCVDADTCEFRMLLGFGVSSLQRVRFCDVDAPGKYTEKGPFATQWTEDRLSSASSIVIYVQMRPECVGGRCERKSFDRVLGYVVADGIDLGQAMLAGGIADLAKKRCR